MKMKAITVMGPGKIEYGDVEMRPLEEDEVLIKVMYTGICATDLAIFTGDCSFVRSGEITYPCRIGHEFAGVVVKAGPKVTKFKVGDRVITDNGIKCGKCEACLKGDYANCKNDKSVGTINCWDGSYAEYMYMPERHTYHLSDNVDFKQAALIEPTSMAVGAMRSYEITKDSVVAVIGTGPIGIGTAALAKKRGAKQVIIVGRTPAKLEIAKKCGVDIAICTKDGDPVEQVRAITGGFGVDYTIETSGGLETPMQAIQMTRKKGTVALVAFYEHPIPNFDIDAWTSRSTYVVGVMGEPGNMQMAEHEFATGLDLSPIITHIVDFKDAPAFFEHAQETKKERIKALVRIGAED